MKDEVAKKKRILEESSQQGATLETLKGTPGWEEYAKIVTEVINDLKDRAFSSKRISNWNDYLFYRAKYDSYVKMLAIVDMKIERGKKASKELEELSD